MKYTLSLILTLVFLVGAASAQSTSETLHKRLPDMSSDAVEGGVWKVRETAQQDWQKICMEAGAPGKEELRAEVNKLMVAVLNSEAPLETKCWMLQQMQWTGDASVVPTLAKLLDSKEVRLRDRAARALALNPSKEAADALKANPAPFVQEALAARTKKVEGTPFPFASARDALEISYLGDNDFAKAMAGFDKAEPQEQARLLAALKVREDKGFTDLAVKAVGSSDEFVKKNAVLALEKIGTVRELPLLLELLDKYDRGLVETVLVNNASVGMDEALVQAAKAANDPGKFEQIAKVLTRRNSTSVLPAILEKAAKDDCPNRLGLLQAAEGIAEQGDVGKFVDIVLKLPAGRERDEADKIIARIAKEDASAVIEKMNDSNSAALLPMLGRIGGAKALETVKKHLSGKFENDAIRALCNWPNAVVADDLLALAESSTASDQNKISALRAFARVISLPDNEIGIKISGKDKVAKLGKAMDLSKRLDEKRLILSRLNAIRNRESIEFALKYVSDPDLKENAFQALVELAHHDGLRRPNKKLLDPALDQIISESKNDGLKDRAKRYRNAP